MNHDIEAYLNGKLSGEELKAFEEEMSLNPEFRREIRQFSRLTQDIEMQVLREQVASALQDGRSEPSTKKGLLRWLAAMGGLVLLTMAVYFLYFNHKNEAPTTAPIIEKQQADHPEETPPQKLDNQPTLTPEKAVPDPEKKQPETNKHAPVAENKTSGKLPSLLHPAPDVRGENSENKAWKAMLDQVWYTEYPPKGTVFSGPFTQADQLLKARDFNKAYVQLQRLERNLPANDTLHFLKGYCLLEMGEGTDAVAYFEKLEERQPTWAMQLQWYRGLGLLLAGEKEKAVAEFRKIAATPKHLYRGQSQKAIELMK